MLFIVDLDLVMTEDALELRTFAEIGAAMEENGQQYCPCCQHSYSWGDDEESENVPTVLTCRHTLCSAVRYKIFELTLRFKLTTIKLQCQF